MRHPVHGGDSELERRVGVRISVHHGGSQPLDIGGGQLCTGLLGRADHRCVPRAGTRLQGGLDRRLDTGVVRRDNLRAVGRGGDNQSSMRRRRGTGTERVGEDTRVVWRDDLQYGNRV